MKYKFFFLSIVLSFATNHVSAQLGSAVIYLKNDSILHVFINFVSQRALLDLHGQGIPYKAIDSLLTPDSTIAYQLQGIIPKSRIERRVNIYFFNFSLIFPSRKTTPKKNTIIPPLNLSDVIAESDTAIQLKDPLENKNYGIEINPLWLLAGIPFSSYLVIDGGLSLFNLDRKAEITFQIDYRSDKESPSKLSYLDLIYRRFVGEYQGGFYVSGGIRYMYIHEKKNKESYSREERMLIPPDIFLKYYSDRNVGVMIGFGFRHFFHSGFYYGFGIELGKYIFCGDTHLEEPGFDAYGVILDIDLIRIGFAF
jgi:hypothetical protein